jgi:hypothetical protein
MPYEDLVELARMCARNARTRRAETSPTNSDRWRRNIRPKLLRWVTSLKSATNLRLVRNLGHKTVGDKPANSDHVHKGGDQDDADR